MTDEDNSTVDALGHNAMASDDGNMDADFGALEMFDSNAAAADDAPPPSSSVADGAEGGRKHRKKKDKKKKAKDVPYEEGEHRRAKRRHAPEADAAVAHEDDEPAEEEQEETAETNGGEKRKRRSSDGGAAAEEGKRRKKKRKAVAAAEEEEPVHEGDEFLHKDHPPHAAVAEEDSGDDEFASAQGSPSAAHARRLSQVHDEQEREKALSNMDVENLAREAFNEHMNGSNNNNGAPDVEMQDAAGAAEQEEAEAESRPKRSTRKKAKPSFFEQPQDEEEYPEEGLEGDLPSPSALTPKPRKRTKAATKKTARRRNGDDDDEAEAKGPFDINDIDQPSGRRNRMEGFTKGRFTDEELAAITKQVQAFAQEHELSQHEVNEMIQAPGGTSAGEAHAQLWSRLFAECPKRHRQKVINITRKKFHNFVARGTWTIEQDRELRAMIDVHGTAWSKIAGLINRHPEDLRDRYRNYIVCGDAQRKDTWDQEEERRLTQYVIEAMATIDDLRAMQPSRKLLQKPYEELIDWQNVSERMARTRSRLQCITKWKSMNLKTHGRDKLVSSQPDSEMSFYLERARRQIMDMPVTERYRLVLAIRTAEPASDQKIPWHRLNDKQFRNKWHRATQMVLWHRLRRTVPGWDTKTPSDCARFLAAHYDQKDELPDVDGDHYDIAEEMNCIQSLSNPSSSSASANRKSGGGHSSWAASGHDNRTLSADFVHNSDDEVDPDAAPKEDEIDKAAAPAPTADMQIDPALMGEQPPSPDTAANAHALAAVAAAAAQNELDNIVGEEASTPVRKPNSTPARKPPSATYGKKSRSSKKRSSATMLSQDPIEDDDSAQLPPSSAASKKSRKGFQSAGQPGATKVEATPDEPSADSSDMEDMADLPAQMA